MTQRKHPVFSGFLAVVWLAVAVVSVNAANPSFNALVWTNSGGVITPIKGPTNVVRITSGLADNTTNVAMVVDTATPWSNGASLINGNRQGTNTFSVNYNGGLVLGTTTKDFYGGLPDDGYVILQRWDTAIGEPGRFWMELRADDSSNMTGHSSFQIAGDATSAYLFLSWDDPMGVGPYFDVSLSEANAYLAIGIDNVEKVKFWPSAPNGTTPHFLNTDVTHTSGNLAEIANNGTNKFTVAALSGYTGAGTLFLSDDGTYKAAGSGDVTGPASSTDNDISVFNGATGKIIKRSTSAATLGDASSATFTLSSSLNGATDPNLIFTNAQIIASSPLLAPAGTSSTPSFALSTTPNTGYNIQGSGELRLAIAGASTTRFLATQIDLAGTFARLGLGSGTTSADTSISRDGAANNLQVGDDASTPSAQTFKGPDGSGTDRPGGAMTFAAGKGTGTGLGGAWIAQTSITNATGTTAQTLGNGIYIYASDAALTESSATGVFTVALPASKYIGIDVHAVTHADDNTDFTATTDTFNVTAIAKSTAISSNVSALQTSTIGSAGSTLTTAWTVTDNGDNTFTLKNNAVASLTQVRLKTKWQVRICSDAPATITPL